MLAVPQGSPPGDPTASSGPCALFHPEPRPAPETRVPREGGEGQARTWWVVTKQEALELHFLARRHPEDRLRSHGNGQTAAGRRSACAGPCVLRGRGAQSRGFVGSRLRPGRQRAEGGVAARRDGGVEHDLPPPSPASASGSSGWGEGPGPRSAAGNSASPGAAATRICTSQCLVPSCPH